MNDFDVLYEEAMRGEDEGGEQAPNPLGRILRRSGLVDLPPPKPLVAGLLDYPAAVVLVGPYGSGKTFLALALACSVATGTTWLGKEVERRKVLLVIGEGGNGLDDRIAAWESGYHNGVPVSDDDLIIDLQPRSLTLDYTWAQITEQCLTEDIGFVILDTLSSLAPDGDETKDAAKIIRHMTDLATAIGGTVLLVHHPGWSDAGRTRGGYQFEANADSVLVLSGTPDVPVVSLLCKKMKDRVGGHTYWMRRTTYQLLGHRAGRSSVVLSEVNPDQAGVPIIERVLVALDGVGEVGSTGPQLMAELGIPDEQRSTFYRHLSRAATDEQIEKRGKANSTRYYLAGTGA